MFYAIAHSTIKCYQDNDVVDCSSGTCLNSTAGKKLVNWSLLLVNSKYFNSISEVDGHKAVVRSCNPLHIDGSDYCINTTIPDLGVQGKVCFCHTDLCNSSTSNVMNYVIFGTIMIFFLL